GRTVWRDPGARNDPGTPIAIHIAREGPMPGIRIIAVSLIVLGIIALAYEGVTHTTRGEVVQDRAITAPKEKKETIPLSPVVGVLALVGGVALLVFGGRGRP